MVVVHNIFRDLAYCHSFLWDIRYANIRVGSFNDIANLFQDRPLVEDWIFGCEERDIDKTDWYGWYIGYYIEGVLIHYMFIHKIITQYHWIMVVMPTLYTSKYL